MYLSQPKDPIRDALEAITGTRPPVFVRGYSCYTLTDREWETLQEWAIRNRRPAYLTGVGVIEAAQLLVDDAVASGNIPPPDPFYSPVSCVLRRYKRLANQYEKLIIGVYRANAKAEAEASCRRMQLRDLKKSICIKVSLKPPTRRS